MKSKIIFLYFLFSCITNNIFCQKSFAPLVYKPLVFTNIFVGINKPNVIVAQKKQYQISTYMMVNEGFYCSNLGFFCKQELKLAKITKFRLPLAIRLGSLQYIDYLEGKPNTIYFNK